MQKINGDARSYEKPSDISLKEKGPSKMAEMIALHRVVESLFPEGQRICYDPYAIYFVDPKTLEFAARNPEKVKEMKEHYESLFPGLGNSIRARVRYFDDFAKSEVDQGIEQLVILGAGYDTRAYRIKGLERIRVFEVDHPATQAIKQEKIKSIFGQVPKNVAYVPVDLLENHLEKMLLENGYDKSKKSLFIMEGLVMYIPAKAVDDLLSFIVRRSAKGSKIIFDYYPQSLVDGTSNLQAATNVRKYVEEQGEPLLFGIKEGEAVAFLSERGFSQIADVSSKDYHKAYFHGANKDRAVSNLLYFAHAAVL
jgi:methyltransferase (TIGR00027 family)